MRLYGCVIYVNAEAEIQPQSPAINTSFTPAKATNQLLTYLQR